MKSIGAGENTFQSEATEDEETPNHTGGIFASTRWSMVLEAGSSRCSSPGSQRALGELCRIYWRPLYLFLRRHGHSQPDAQDTTQAFFVHLLRSRAYTRADPDKGRFRSFLLGALKHFVADARDYASAAKRGGGVKFERWDEKALAAAEAQMANAREQSADVIYDREWARSVLNQTMQRLERECELIGKTDFFGYLKPFLAAPGDAALPYLEMQQRLRRPLSTLRSDALRLRNRYRAILREEIRGTVASDATVDEELRHLCRVLADA
jgi:DNA-directed RNA polymerase specialized sigma24 family protein